MGNIFACTALHNVSHLVACFSPVNTPPPGPVDEMGVMLNSIKEGGVSLTGQEQPFTHDHFRKSFIRRCKNPVINEKVHTLRALQSTLKVRRRKCV